MPDTEQIRKVYYETMKDGTRLYDWDYNGRDFRVRQTENQNHTFRVELINDGWTPIERTDEYEVWVKEPNRYEDIPTNSTP